MRISARCERSVLAIFFISQGVVQNFKPSDNASIVEPFTTQVPKTDDQNNPVADDKGRVVLKDLKVDTQTIFQGPAASQTAIKMFGDFADLWERAAADGTPVRAIVGDDPVEFADAFAEAYTGKRWIDKERARLTEAIENAERGEQE